MFWSLARAMFSEGMNPFKYHTKDDAKGFKKILLPAAIAVLIMGAMALYAGEILKALTPLGLAELLPVLALVTFSAIGLFEGIYKVPSLLFDCRDNDLLFSLPVPRRRILALRVLKLVVFQIIYNAIFLLPVFVTYAAVATPAPLFYPVSLLALLLFPLLPTAIAVLLGYLIKSVSIHFRFQKLAQALGTIAILAVVLTLAFNSETLLETLLANLTSITDVITRVYYPAGAYANLIGGSPNFLHLAGFLAATILPFAAVIALCSLRYFKIISRSSAHAASRHSAVNIKSSGVVKALVMKEISRYFASPVFIFNTAVGPFILLLASFQTFPVFVYVAIVCFAALSTSITSSAISIEGKSFSITKSLPVAPAKILAGKVFASLVIATPVMFIADIIFICHAPATPLDIAAIFALTILVPTFSGLLGLIFNLQYPKMTAKDDTEVVKQSLSAMLATFTGFGLAAAVAAVIFLFRDFPGTPFLVVALFALLDFILWRILQTWGAKKFRGIEL